MHSRLAALLVEPQAQTRRAAAPSAGPRCCRAAASAAALDHAAPASAAAPPAPGPLLLNQAVLHSASREQLECIGSLQPFFEERILPLLTPVEELWQPSDVLPDPSSPAFFDEVSALRQRTLEVPDELLVCLVGDMITEEALPTYMAMLNTLDGVRDESGRCQHPYARWTRQWIAEENRHGDLLNKYLWLTGRVDMVAVERTIQQLIGAGMDPQTENNAYLCFIFTSFQERATKLSHGATARLAKAAGDETLARACGVIAADEGRHETAYTRTVDAIFQRDPNNAVLSFADMMRKRIVMPAHLMDDGRHAAANSGRNLFEDFSLVAEDIGVYTAADYVDIIEHLVERWNVPQLTGLSAEAQAAQEFLCTLPARFRRLAERKAGKKARAPRTEVQFSWLRDRKLALL